MVRNQIRPTSKRTPLAAKKINSNKKFSSVTSTPLLKDAAPLNLDVSCISPNSRNKKSLKSNDFFNKENEKSLKKKSFASVSLNNNNNAQDKKESETPIPSNRSKTKRKSILMVRY